MTRKERAARQAAAAVDEVLDQMPAPGSKPNAADVLVANVAMHAADCEGVTADDYKRLLRRR